MSLVVLLWASVEQIVLLALIMQQIVTSVPFSPLVTLPRFLLPFGAITLRSLITHNSPQVFFRRLYSRLPNSFKMWSWGGIEMPINDMSSMGWNGMSGIGRWKKFLHFSQIVSRTDEVYSTIWIDVVTFASECDEAMKSCQESVGC